MKNLQRRGSTYIIVVGAAMLITIFMMAGLTVIRIQRNQFQNAFDSQQARLNAEAALDLGLDFIRTNPSNWRDQPLNLQSQYGAPASLNLQLTDPFDNDLHDSSEDPVVLVATGTARKATQIMRARLNLDAQGFNCLQSAMHAGNRVHLLNSTVSTDSVVSYDQMMTLTGLSRLHSDVIGFTLPSVGGSSEITGEITTPGDLPKDTPSRESIDLVNLYSANAVEINVNDLYFSDYSVNRLSNSNFLLRLQDWLEFDCQAMPNANRLLVSKRESSQAGVGQDVKSLMYNGGVFRLSCNFKNNGEDQVQARIQLRIETTADGVRYYSTPDVAAKPKEEVQIMGAVTPIWQGNLLSAHWIVNTTSGPPIDFEISQPGIYEETYPDGAFAFRSSLLGPQTNPFGSGQTQAEGLYVLDAENREVFIENSKVEATLVLKNSSAVIIRGAMHLRNSVYNYPTIVAQNDLQIEVDVVELFESSLDANFNPVAAPFLATHDTDKDDEYESRIDGLVYVNGDLSINGNLRSRGVWITDNDLTITGTAVDVTYDSLYYEEPPPGFVDVLDMKVLPGSFTQVVEN